MKKGYDYFDEFVKLLGYSAQAAKMLDDSLRAYDEERLRSMIMEIHGVEHAADLEKHDMIHRLAREFITPIEREDIMELAQEIDDVTDAVEDVLLRMHMYHIQAIRPEALDFVEVIVKCCDMLVEAMGEFHNYRKSEKLRDCIVEVNRLEEEGDRIYTEAVYRLYDGSTAPIEVMAWTELFDRFEKCCDACEDVADVIESVIMKNT